MVPDALRNIWNSMQSANLQIYVLFCRGGQFWDASGIETESPKRGGLMGRRTWSG
ncbi:MAG: hypothetical protein K2Q22_07265 [Cytophagales bacterium]|nr:hypothetical protein [Cytophagales bacterium]